MNEADRTPLLVLTGGGSGGHTMPALAVAQLALEQDLARIVYIGGKAGIEQAQAEQAGLDFHAVRTGKFRRSSTWYRHLQAKNIADIFNVLAGVLQSLRLLRQLKPDCVLGTGGYVSVPVVAAAALLRIPTTIHEQTVVLGLANRITARLATRIALTSELSLESLNERGRTKASVVGNPIRTPILEGDADRCRSRVGTNPSLPTVLVLGGAQGAEVINQAILQSMALLLDHCNVIHQAGTGAGLRSTAIALAQHHRELGETDGSYAVTEFFDAGELGDAYALADLVLGRSGAGTTNELIATGTPSVLVPLVPTGGDEQRKIAASLEQAGAAVVVPNDELMAESLAALVTNLLNDRPRLGAMEAAARSLYRGDATAPLLELALHANG